MPRNPAWTRDELILALDLYFRVNPLHTSEKNPEIQELSAFLNALPVHVERPDPGSFRNPNGVYMKLCNFLRLDPTYDGVGLDAGSRLDEDVWSDFASDLERLHRTALAIRQAAPSFTPAEVRALTVPDRDEFTEGRVLTALHKRRERNEAAVKRKKATVLDSSGRLACEACGFDFAEVYGDLGAGYAECHHTVPLGELTGTTTTRLQDLAILCANCHRIIHRSRPMMSVAGLGEIVHSEVVDL